MLLLNTAPALVLTALLAGAAAFQGLWMVQLWQCQAGFTDESWLRIEAGRFSFYESSGPVLAVVAGGPAAIAGITELSGRAAPGCTRSACGWMPRVSG